MVSCRPILLLCQGPEAFSHKLILLKNIGMFCLQLTRKICYVGTISLSGIVTVTDASTVKISATASAPNVYMMGNADNVTGLPKAQNKCTLNALQIQ